MDGIKRIAELGLGAMEIEFVRGVKMGLETARSVAETASKLDIKLSAHGPYYINLNSMDPAKIKASQRMILETARAAAACGAVSIVFHPAFYADSQHEEVYQTVKKYLSEVMSQLRQDKNPVRVRPEIMGKHSEFGTLDEILRLCTEVEGLAPCIDFAHWHARTGINSFGEFSAVLEKVERELGKTAISDMHFHISGIRYSEKGEISHIELKDSDLNYTDMLKAMKRFNIKGLAICESPNLEEDALLLQSEYAKIR